MAQIIITIPDNKKDWLINGAAITMKYTDTVANPDFDDMQIIDPDTNPMYVPNPLSKVAFIKSKMIEHLKQAAIRGNNEADIAAHATEADNITIT